ncbi:MAG: GGDEF domain-containing phosphodiesterase [Pseudomonadota bacterium]
MLLQGVKRKDAIEIASIAGIVAIVVFAELSFGLFGIVAERLSEFGSGSTRFFMALFMGGWIGLCLYSLRRRSDLRRETEARLLAEEDFAFQKICDPVTNLPNRKGFELVLNQKITEEPGRSYTVLGVEICNLDTITSVHGTEVATRVEIALADELVETMTEDDLVARGGRAMFYALTPGDSIDETQFRIDSVIEAITAFSSGGIDADGLRLQTFITFGVLNVDGQTCRGPQWDAENIMRRVDFASLRARRRGNGAIETFDWGMESDMNQRAIIEASLGNAIRKGQIIPYFQPLIDLKTHRVAGLEILARWNHPAQGNISPGVFIPIAEDIGVLRVLTLSILRQACEAAREWPSDIQLAINISPTDLRDRSIIDRFMDIFNTTGLTADRIEVEITENALVEEAGSISGAIEALKQEGMSLSIDDFGTGYASLHHLRILPFDKLKIDQSFVKDMATNQDSRAIVQAIIAMSQSLGLKTTAEGIEIGQNAEILQEFGCTVGQGFLYAKALPASEVPAFLENFDRQVERVVAIA